MERSGAKLLETPRGEIVSVAVRPNPLDRERSLRTYASGANTIEALVEQEELRRSGSQVEVLLDGHHIPEADWCSILPSAGQVVEMSVIPHGGGGEGNQTAKLVIGLILSLATIGLGVGGIAVAGGLAAMEAGAVLGTLGAIAGGVMGVVSGIMAMAAKGPSSLEQNDADIERAPIGTQNSLARGEAYPRIYGDRRFAPYFHVPPVKVYRGDDEWLNVIYTLGEGPLAVYDFRIGDQPLSAWRDIILGRDGAQEPFVHEGYDDDLADFQVVKTTGATEGSGKLWDGSGTHGNIYTQTAEGRGETLIVSESDNDFSILVFAFPKGFYGIEKSNPSKPRWVAVDMNIDFRDYDDPGSPGTWMGVDDADANGAGNLDSNVNASTYLGAELGVWTNLHRQPISFKNNNPFKFPEHAMWYEDDQVVPWSPQPDITKLDPGYEGLVRFSGSSLAPFTRAIGVKLPYKSTWQFRIRKFAEDRRMKFKKSDVPGQQASQDNSQNISNKNKYADVVFQSLSSRFEVIKKDDVSNQVYVEFQIKQDSGISGILSEFNCRAKSVLPFYDLHGTGSNNWGPITAEGKIRKNKTDLWDSGTNPNGHLRPSSAFGEILHDVLTGGYNSAPLPESNIDSDSLVEMDAANAHGGAGYLQNQSNTDPDREGHFLLLEQIRMWDIAKNIAGAGRSSVSMHNNKFRVVPDVRRSTYAQCFASHTVRNFKLKRFFRKKIHALKVNFRSREIDDEPNQVTVYLGGYSRVASGNRLAATEFGEITLWGVMTEYQAKREASYHIRGGLLQREVVTFDTDVEAIQCQKGSLVKVNHDAGLYGYSSSRVRNIFKTSITGDITAIEMENAAPYNPEITYGLKIRHTEDDKLLNIGPCSVDADYPRHFFPQTAISYPAAIDYPARDDLVMYGPDKEESVDCIIMSVKARATDLGASIVAMPYIDEVYDLDYEDMRVGEWEPSVYNPYRKDPATIAKVRGPKPPEIVNMYGNDSSFERIQGGALILRVGVHYQADTSVTSQYAPTSHVEVESSMLTGNWVPEGMFSAGEKTIFIGKAIAGEGYRVRIRSVSPKGQTSPWVVSQINNIELPTILDAITGLRLDESSDQLSLVWDYEGFPEDLLGFEVRASSIEMYNNSSDDWDQWELANIQHPGVIHDARFNLEQLTPGLMGADLEEVYDLREMRVLVRARDIYGGTTPYERIDLNLEAVDIHGWGGLYRTQADIVYNASVWSTGATTDGMTFNADSFESTVNLDGGGAKRFWGHSAEHHWRQPADLYWQTREVRNPMVWEEDFTAGAMPTQAPADSAMALLVDYDVTEVGFAHPNANIYPYRVMYYAADATTASGWNEVKRNTILPKFNSPNWSVFFRIEIAGGHNQMRFKKMTVRLGWPLRHKTFIQAFNAGQTVTPAFLTGDRYKGFEGVSAFPVAGNVGDYIEVVTLNPTTGPSFKYRNAAGGQPVGWASITMKVAVNA